ncbi:ASPIC/UnbV domain-containing protein [Verrucomicrobiaceae bacterium 227]
MRTDAKLAENSLRSSEEWKKNEIGGVDDQRIDTRLEDGDEMIDGELRVHSLSGHERNHFFLNHDAGESFSDISALSGLDSDSDSRGAVIFDYDRDGMPDLALVNANQPLTQLFHNEIGEISPGGRGLLALRFEGGSTSSEASEWSNRDGYGAMVEVVLPDGTLLKREHRCGDGYASQGSRTMLIGIGEAGKATKVSVRWPSGRTSLLTDVKEGELVTIREDETAEGHEREVYRKEVKPAIRALEAGVVFPLARETPGQIQVYTTMATWCASCLKHLPSLAILQDDSVALFAVPIDPTDDEAKLGEYLAKHSPPYEMLRGISSPRRDEVSEYLSRALNVANPALPSTIIADSEGRILDVMAGIPTVSQLRKLRK